MNFVVRSQESFNSTTQQGDTGVKVSSYLNEKGIQGILCLPIINMGQIKGVAYLESKTNAEIFKTKQTGLLELLSSNVAMAIENAVLYRNLEQRVEERTSEIKQMQSQLLESAHKAGMAEIATGGSSQYWQYLNLNLYQYLTARRQHQRPSRG